MLTKRRRKLGQGFTDREQAALYDRMHPPRERSDFRFYLPMIMDAQAVLDVGCGTGPLLHMAREAGHTRRLVGLDPAVGMLEQARSRSDIEWVLGDLSDVAFEREFDLAVMTGHAFQELIGDDEIPAAFVAVRSALTDGGRFAFETRNPAVRAWEKWTPENGTDFKVDGVPYRWEADVELPVTGDVVRYRTRYLSPRWERPQESVGELRFVAQPKLNALLDEAGLVIDEQFGNWDRSPVSESSPEIITIARRPS
jgi:SAM-dependent methyltransferase